MSKAILHFMESAIRLQNSLAQDTVHAEMYKNSEKDSTN